MKIMLLLCSLALVACSMTQKPIDRIAFGSCAREYLEQPIWTAIGEFKPDLWIWAGDNVYGDTDDMEILAAKYETQKSIPGYAALRNSCAVIGTWDDHDYGVNNGGKEHGGKVGSQKALLDFLGEEADSLRRSQKGVYWSYDYGIGERSVRVILLDCRYFRDRLGSGGDILGEVQWEWLAKTLEDSRAKIHLIVSGIQVLSEEHRYEKWADFPKSRKRLLDLVARQTSSRVVFLSGDRHFSEISRIEYGADKADLVEITSSSLTHSWTGFSGEDNKHRVGDVFANDNFGAIVFDWIHENIELQIRSQSGNVERRIGLPIPQ